MPSKLLNPPDFEAQAPGTVLRDFEALLDLIDGEGLPLTASHLLALNVLEKIDRVLAHPLELRLKRAVQKSYPHINGLYLLLRASGMSVVDTRAKQPRLKLDPVALAAWSSLNCAERYFALLKAWWARASEDIVGERPTSGMDSLAKVVDFIVRAPASGALTVETPRDLERLRYHPGFYNLALMELFGLLELRAISPSEGKGWQPEWMQVTDWGRNLLGGYAEFLHQALDPEAKSAVMTLSYQDLFDPLECFDQWSRIVRPAIEGWRRDLELPAHQFQPAQHLFKVSLGTDCWRRIGIGGRAGLDALAAAVLDAFDFDSDHLYSFSYKDRFGRTVEIDHPYLAGESDHALADEVKIGDIPLSEGMRMGFLFDFGSQWSFEIETESLDTGNARQKAQVLEAHGEPPAQYGD